MGLPVKQQATYWGIVVGAFLFLLYVLGNVILPFVIGGALAYCLDPIADRLERAGCSRAIAVTIITLVAGLAALVLILLVIPTLISETTALIEATPGYIQTLTERFPQLMDETSTVRQQLTAFVEMLQSRGGELINGVFSGALGLINILVLFVIVPVVTFYLLLDWDNMVARIDELLPRDHADTVRRLASEIDNTLASFIRGQGTVCLVLGIYYALALMLAGLNFGIVVGFVAGLISFIPYIGALVGGALALGLALFQYWGAVEATPGVFTTDWLAIGIVGIIFMVGQFLEGNILTPKLVGNSIGLHPVWLIFALSVFGSLFGFVGMLVAVPVAAILGVVTRFIIGQYRQSRLYRGLSDKN